MGKIVWFFSLGHGHYAQFLNFQEACPPEIVARSAWVGVSGFESGDRLAPYLPAGLRYRRNEVWHVREGARSLGDGDVLFVAAGNLQLVPLMRRHRSYLYMDLTPSLRRSLHPWYEHTFLKSSLLEGIRQRARASVPRSATGIFAMSEWAAKGIRTDYGLDKARVRVTLPGANLERWRYVDRTDRLQGPVRILMVGGEFRRKGGETLLRWAEATKVRGWELDIVTWPGDLPDWVSAAIGGAGPTAQSASLGPRLPQVRVHTGLQANTPQLMSLFRDADLFCLPTNADGSSIASLEAMACGLPVIVGAVGGIPELVEDGKTGYLIPPADTGALEDRLGALVSDRGLRLAVGRAAREACEHRFNVQRQIREIAAAIDADS